MIEQHREGWSFLLLLYTAAGSCDSRTPTASVTLTIVTNKTSSISTYWCSYILPLTVSRSIVAPSLIFSVMSLSLSHTVLSTCYIQHNHTSLGSFVYECPSWLTPQLVEC